MRTRLSLTAAAVLALTAPSLAGVGIGADVVSRYVWRGTDYGDAACVQPWISYAAADLEVGAWSSWAVQGSGADDNELFATWTRGPVELTLTDYYSDVPGDLFDLAEHVLEAEAAVDLGGVGVRAAVDVLGDAQDSHWLELSLPLLQSEEDDEDGAALRIGAGDGFYTLDGGWGLVSLSLDVTKSGWLGRYILNPDAEISFLVIGRSF